MFLDFSCQIQSSSAFIQLCDKTKNQTRENAILSLYSVFRKLKGKNLEKKNFKSTNYLFMIFQIDFIYFLILYKNKINLKYN